MPNALSEARSSAAALAALHRRYDGPIPDDARAVAALGSGRAVAQARAEVSFFRTYAGRAIGRLRRLDRRLADPTLPLAEAARLESRRDLDRGDLAFARRQHGRAVAYLAGLGGIAGTGADPATAGQGTGPEDGRADGGCR